MAFQQRTRINHQIRLSPVRLISDDGEQLGILTIEEARKTAQDKGLDLVEVDPNARPIVCKIMDWGRAKYDLAKKEKAAKRHEKVLEIKQVKFRPGIDNHDFETKLTHARRFLEEGRRTKITIMFRRRDLRRPENGVKILKRVASELAIVGKVETRPGKIENRDLTMVMVPLLGVGHSVKDAKKAAVEKAEATERKRLARAAAREAAETGDGDAPSKPAADPAEATPAAAKAARAKATPAAAKAVSAAAVKSAPVAVAKATPATADDESETADPAVKTSETVTSN
ncbi:MAG: translation initiation factor IF-3 [Acidobacteria bacterium]|nr:translation initiation factor IF-3 [Acidobacteriota bacterium]